MPLDDFLRISSLLYCNWNLLIYGYYFISSRKASITFSISYYKFLFINKIYQTIKSFLLIYYYIKVKDFLKNPNTSVFVIVYALLKIALYNSSSEG